MNQLKKEKKRQKILTDRFKCLWKKIMAFVFAFVLFGSVFMSTESVSAASLNTFNPDTWSVNFTYNGYFSGWDGSSFQSAKRLYWGSCTKVGSALTKSTSTSNSSYTYYKLPTSKNTNAYFKFEKAFVYTDPDTLETKYYDVVMYAWSPTTWSSTQDYGVVANVNGYIEFTTYAWVNSLTTYTNGSQTTMVNTEWHFYETGTSTEASVAGVFYINDNDDTEGYKVLSGDCTLYVQEENSMELDSENYVVGTKSVEGTPDADIYAVFSSSSSKPLQLSYKTSVKLRTNIRSNSYSISYNIIDSGDGIPSGVSAPDTIYISKFINTTQAKTKLFAKLSAAGYSWDGWYTSSDTSKWSTAYSGTTSTQSNVTLYSTFTKLYGNLTVTKQIDTGSLGTSTTLSGFAFRLYGTSTAGDSVDLYAVTDSSGKATFSDVPVGTYTLDEVTAYEVNAAKSTNSSAAAIISSVTWNPNLYVETSTKSVTISSNTTATATWTNQLKQWRITITKLDSKLLTKGQAQDGATLEGAVYGLYNASGTRVAEYTTDANGQFTTTYFACGDGYYIQEISPSTGYELDETKYYIAATASLFENQYNDASFKTGSYVSGYQNCVYEDPSNGGLVVTKQIDTGSLGTSTTLSGFAFRLYGTSSAGDSVDLYAVTDSTGKATFSDVPVGTYTLDEVTASEVSTAAQNGNTSASAIASSVTWDSTLYTSTSTQSVTISASTTATCTWTNVLKQWRITITKLDSILLKKGESQDGATLQGAVYGLYDASNTKVAEYATDANGQFTTGYFACGDGYYIQEISPSEGYELDETKYYIAATASLFNNQYNDASFKTGSYTSGYQNCVYEDPSDGSLVVTKKVNTGGLNVDVELFGFAFRLYGTSSSGETVDLYAVTDSTGKATFSSVPIGTYTLDEVTASEVSTAARNGNTSASVIASSVTWDSDLYVETSTQSVTIKVNTEATATWTNVLKLWRITITKLDSTLLTKGQSQEGATLKGAVYGLYDASGTKVAEYTTDANGQFTTTYFVCGDGYYIQEISPSVGYVLDETKYYIDASASLFENQYNNASFKTGSYISGYQNCVYEDPILGSVTLIKYGSNGKALSGVTYQIYDSNGNLVAAKKTGSNGKVVFSDLVPGTYTIYETATVDGYTLLAEPITVTIPYDLTKTEASTYSADTSKGVWDEENSVWRFYNLTYTVNNAYNFDLPLTGATGVPVAGVACGIFLVLFAAGIILFGSRRNKLSNIM